MLLLLFDVDGTLFLTDDALYNRAAMDAIRKVFGLDLPADSTVRVDHPGQTARWITREILRNEGLDDAAIEAGLAPWCDALSERYVELLARAETSGWRAAPGAADVLALLEASARLALVTGNPEAVARARLGRLELDRFFPPGQGAFGCEADERPALIELARRRAGGDGRAWPREQTVMIGDAPADVAGARAAGVRSILLTSERFDRDALSGGDAFVSRLTDLPAALEVV